MEDTGLDLRGYWNLVRRWWWILVAGVALGIGAALFLDYLQTRGQPDTYRSTAKILVQNGQSFGLPTSSDIQTAQHIAFTYSDLIKTRPIMEKVALELGLPESPDSLIGKINVGVTRSIISITATDTNPQATADLANTTADVFIADFLERQLIQAARLRAALGQTGIDDPAFATAQISTLGTLSILENALVPSAPESPSRGRSLFLGAIIGLLGAIAVIHVLERLDDRVKSAETAKAVTGLTTLGTIMRVRSNNGLPYIHLSNGAKNSTLEEPYRFLRTNLEFAAVGLESVKVLVISSALPEEGKSTTAVNLASTVAKEGRSVVLIDADLRAPSLHRIFDLDSTKGLTNVLLGSVTLDEALSSTSIPTLKVLTSGPLPPDSSQILRTSQMEGLIIQLRRMADLVIFDTPPLLAATDASILAAMSDCVLLVVDSSRVRQDSVRRGAELLKKANPALMGVVLNKMPQQNLPYYYYITPTRTGAAALNPAIRAWNLHGTL